jgi:O-methyltransferase
MMKKIVYVVPVGIQKVIIKVLSIFIGASYNVEGIITNNNCDFMREPRFIESHELGCEHGHIRGTGFWTEHVQHWAISHASRLEGDFVECGVKQGGSVISTMTYIGFKLSNKVHKYFLFDTFCGLDKSVSEPKKYLEYKDQYPDVYDEVVNLFKDYPNVVIIKGSVPKTLSEVDIKKVAYLHVDMNTVYPEVEALKFFWDKIVSGGIVVLDDYGRPGHEEQKRGADGFADSVGIKILSLPTGQGIIIKS